MKVYQVVKGYYDGSHEHGSYRSPLFANREDAEAFKREVDPTDGGKHEVEEWSDRGVRWWSDTGWEQTEPRIVEHEIVEDWDGDVPRARDCRKVTWT